MGPKPEKLSEEVVSMYSDRDLYEDLFPQYQNCCNCGSEETCATAGSDHYCGDCWREYLDAKERRKKLATSKQEL